MDGNKPLLKQEANSWLQPGRLTDKTGHVYRQSWQVQTSEGLRGSPVCGAYLQLQARTVPNWRHALDLELDEEWRKS
ncbi:hypothetical protein [Paenibacillus ihumii]|uniref:hypothetical protein n=1 Tax=Paenibacillus ihumii TaxID=687436 RepID=UPI00165269A2|nr:hypothetical protein [Paenibacillus ihumii]